MSKIELADTRMHTGTACRCPSCGSPGRYVRPIHRREQYWDWVQVAQDREGHFECYRCESE